MSINLPLTNGAERQAAVVALIAYVNALDDAQFTLAHHTGGVVRQQQNLFGAGMRPNEVAVTLSHADNPETGIDVEELVQVAPAPTHIPTAAEAFSAPAASLSPPGMVYAPIPPAPVLAPPPVSAPPAPNAEADVNGELWSAEKHSSTKTKNADGSWRVKRGAKVDAPPAPPAPAPMAVAPAAAPPAPAPVAAAPTGAPATFAELMNRVMPLMKEGKITPAMVTEACGMNGVANLPALSQNLGAIPAVWATIEMLVG